MTRNQEIASIILNQMGGMGMIKAMTGAKTFVAIENGLMIKFGAKVIQVRLNGLDFYNVEFGTTRGMKYTIKQELENIDCEQLKGTVENLIGLRLSF
jgi:hypothetical protein